MHCALQSQVDVRWIGVPCQSNTNQIPIIYNLFCRNFLLLTKSLKIPDCVNSNKSYPVFTHWNKLSNIMTIY